VDYYQDEMKKKELREKYKNLRAELSNADLEKISEKISSNLLSEFILNEKKISVFIPISKFNEVNTWLIIDKVKADFYLPVIGENDQLKQIHFEGKHQLKQNDWGILEPQFGNEIDAAEIDIVLVPLLTIDNNGYRVGYGKGYYDKFLARCKKECLFVGLYQFDTIEEIDDLNEFDIPLHYCITPARVIRF